MWPAADAATSAAIPAGSVAADRSSLADGQTNTSADRSAPLASRSANDAGYRPPWSAAYRSIASPIRCRFDAHLARIPVSRGRHIDGSKTEISSPPTTATQTTIPTTPMPRRQTALPAT